MMEKLECYVRDFTGFARKRLGDPELAASAEV